MERIEMIYNKGVIIRLYFRWDVM